MSATVNDIEHIESQTYNGVGVVKVFFHPTAQHPDRAGADRRHRPDHAVDAIPPGATPPLILQYNASTVPILQLALSSKTLAEHELNDLANSFMRTQLATVQGAVLPYPYGGKIRAGDGGHRPARRCRRRTCRRRTWSTRSTRRT